MTGTVSEAWSDRALDVYRANLSEDRPVVGESAARIADHYRQRGLIGADLQREVSTVLGGATTMESVASGFRQGFRFLGMLVLGIGLTVAIPLTLAASGLRAPPGSGYS